MAKGIFLTSLKERVGKTTLALGIILNLQQQGKKAGYFKPIGTPKAPFSNKADPDVGFLQSCSEVPKSPYNVLSPVSIPDCYYVDLVNENKKEQFLKNIENAYQDVANEFDYVIIEGAPSLKKFIRIGLDDVSIAERIGINKVVYIETESSDKGIDNLFFTNKYLEYRNIKMKGILFNKIDQEYFARIKELKEDHILRYDIPIIGIIGKVLELMSPRVDEIQAAIGGNLLNESTFSELGKRVENYLIGAMGPQEAAKYLRKVKNVAFITGGDRSDLALVALNEKVSCLILTGYIEPDTSVITKATQQNIPILLSPSDTYTTLRNIERIRPSIKKGEIDLISKMVNEKIDWDLLLG